MASGEGDGFGARDLRASPAIDAWITHELRYGRLQRRYCRQWFSYLSDDDVRLGDAELDGPVAHDTAWQRRLVDEIGERLWAKVKHHETFAAETRADPECGWSAPSRRPLDFRFLNLNRCAIPPADALKVLPDDAFEYLLRQYIARFDYAAFPKEALGVFALIREDRDFRVGDRLLKGLKRLPVSHAEPRDLFLYN
jgi:hypothetical protein